MPFGFEHIEIPENLPVTTDYKRVYVEVNARYEKDGKIRPLSIAWKDGRVLKIDTVIECRKGRSLKYNTSGCRYICKIGMKQFYLYYDDCKWYVELKSSFN